MRRAALLGLLLAGALVLVAAAPAQAHASLVSATPVDGTRVDTAPTEVDFHFDQTVRLADDATQVTADSGQRVDLPARTVDSGTTVVVPLSPSIPPGAYTASYRVVSEDGHVVSGAIRFGVGVEPSIEVAAPAPADPLSTVVEAAQGLVYLGIIALLGVGLATGVLWRFAEPLGRVRGLRVVGWVLLALGTLVRLALAGPIAAATGLPGVVTLSGLAVTLGEVGGIAGLVRLGLLAGLLPGTLHPRLGERRGGRAVAAALSLGVLVTVALDGHAADGGDRVLATIAATGHLAAMAAWVGGLLTLAVAVLPRSGWSLATPASLRRWSMLAFASVATLIVTGEYQAWRQLDPVDSLVDTSYGVTLLVKVGLVTLTAVAGWLAHRLLARVDEREATRPRLRRAVLIEAGTAIAVVAVTTVLVALPPARVTYGPPVTLSAPAGPGTARIDIDTTHTGVQHLTVVVRDAHAGPATVVALTGSLTSASLAAVPARFVDTGDGAWVAAVVVPVAGAWTLQLDLDLGPDGDYSTAASYRVW